MGYRCSLYSIQQPPSLGMLPSSPKGLAEWPNEVPLAHQILMSGDPQICPSVFVTGLENDERDNPTKIWAIHSPRQLGCQRFQKFLKVLNALPEIPKPHTPPFDETNVTQLREKVAKIEQIVDNITNPYLILEFFDLQLLAYDRRLGPNYLLRLTEEEAAHCNSAGKAVDALPDDPEEAAAVLIEAVATEQLGPLDHFYGLRFDNYSGSWGHRETGLGLHYWSSVLYYHFG